MSYILFYILQVENLTLLIFNGINQIEDSSLSCRGISRTIVGKIIKNDLDLNDLSMNMVHDKTMTLFDSCSQPYIVGDGFVVCSINCFSERNENEILTHN